MIPPRPNRSDASAGLEFFEQLHRAVELCDGDENVEPTIASKAPLWRPPS
jgi:hypothetical protein